MISVFMGRPPPTPPSPRTVYQNLPKTGPEYKPPEDLDITFEYTGDAPLNDIGLAKLDFESWYFQFPGSEAY